MSRAALIQAARGDVPLDLLIRGADVVNVFTLEILKADIGILGNRIAIVDYGAKLNLKAHTILEAEGLIATPGLIDTHVHIESSFVTPSEFAKGVLPFGTTTVVIDPHEICNVLGLEGFQYMLEASANLPLRVYLTVPSSVPSVPHLESAGATFEAPDIAQMLREPRVVGVAELMDYSGVIHQQARTAAIVEAGLVSGKALEGHAPLIEGLDLAAYMAAGVGSDHECRSAPEMLEKIRAGMWVYGRENTFRHTVGFLAEALKTVPNAVNVALCTDDTDPDDLIRHGHLNRGLRILLEHGVPTAKAVQIATLNAATRFGLHELGAIASGRYADILLFEQLTDFNPKMVITNGKIVARDGKLGTEIRQTTPAPKQNTVRIGKVTELDFIPKQNDLTGLTNLPILEIDVNRATTLSNQEMMFRNGLLEFPLPKDLLLLSVVPRHGQAHPPSLCLLRGLGLQNGALATTIAHDSHNLIVVGNNPNDMLCAVKAIQTMQGGAVLVSSGQIKASVPLVIAGLLSEKSILEVATEVNTFNTVAREYGIGGASPILCISSLALPVAPFYRLTDFGLVNTISQEFI
jgi:adenine deaminase